MKMKTLTLGLGLMAMSTLSSLAMAKDILTSTPVTYMLSEQLMKGTGVEITYLPPKRYSIERMANWFATKGANQVSEAGKSATVAITIRAIWDQDPTYVYARQGNIRLIEIDASQAISPRAQGVAALKLEDGATSKYVWLNPSNLIRMTAIVGDDLQKLYPQFQEQIQRNQQALMLSVRELINQQQAVIFEKEIDSIVLMSESLEDFASGNQLFVVKRQFKPELEWSEKDKLSLKAQFEQDKTLWLVTDKKPSKILTSLVSPDRILQIDNIDRWGSKGIKTEKPLARWKM
ncbi:ABC transporter substrate-binding protein [Vibrio parahaemolyticus]|uniref:ABC transporter substrate-binding protein n=1 Tax=Vibrio parahaemolyticus TaxID=670 RepID=UPI00044CE591|nr:ABC transporter substrate-binding protein [Vibrio parahaemolyticus]EGR3413675.1 ABC transporter substrate-binding protein [Vibrio parahaemolyticus]EHH2512153.1 ABC transporter substrate-binding protein [Vibrio parahaemolyticus]EJE1250539.1 ABC transporter substrate-binding protein [Vibrio parahaemolyticus]EJE4559609.1 ABC transporter substrate-binding protein [Vibrio parahaemolyticus]EJG1764744.1 ABC transporter substrate-binding protein [Vibrio parahaemolyticus]